MDESDHDLLHLAEQLERQGEVVLARDRYLDILRRRPNHFDALWKLGRLLKSTHYRHASRLTFSQLVEAYPNDPTGYLELAHLSREEAQWDCARDYYLSAIDRNSRLWSAYQGLSYVLEELGDSGLAAYYRDMGFSAEPLQQVSYTGRDRSPIRVLHLVSSTGGNTPTALFLRADRYQIENLVVEYWPRGRQIPDHDVVFNAISDADVAYPALVATQTFKAQLGPTINAPWALQTTGRISMASRLSGIPGVRVPRIAQYAKRELEKRPTLLSQEGFTFPVLLRSVGFHGGRYFHRVASDNQLVDVMTHLPERDVWVIEMLPSAHDTGEYHKYRMMMVQRTLYPIHSVFSRQWKVHDYTGSRDITYRDREVPFLMDARTTLGEAVWERLLEIVQRCPWDYGGIDFDVSDTGEVMVFEANATMAIPDLFSVPNTSARHRAWASLHERIQALIGDRSQH